MRRAAAIFISLILGALGASALSGSSPAVAHLGGEDFQVTSRTVTERFRDVGRPGPTIGDSVLFTGKLFRLGERVGQESGRCDVTRATRRAQVFQCSIVLTFRGEGDLTVQGVLVFRGGESPDPRLAITGGTRAYAGASGEFVLVERPGEPRRYRIHLIR